MVILLVMHLLRILFLIFLVPACGEFIPQLEPGDPVALDPAFSPAVTKSLVAGCSEWNEALPLLKIQCRTSELGAWHVKKTSLTGRIGRTEYLSLSMLIDSDQIVARLGHTSYVKHTMMHEIGHALGFRDHLYDPGALLYPAAPKVMCVDPLTLAAVLEIRPDLSEDAHPTCK